MVEFLRTAFDLPKSVQSNSLASLVASGQIRGEPLVPWGLSIGAGGMRAGGAACVAGQLQLMMGSHATVGLVRAPYYYS